MTNYISLKCDLFYTASMTMMKRRRRREIVKMLMIEKVLCSCWICLAYGWAFNINTIYCWLNAMTLDRMSLMCVLLLLGWSWNVCTVFCCVFRGFWWIKLCYWLFNGVECDGNSRIFHFVFVLFFFWLSQICEVFLSHKGTF